MVRRYTDLTGKAPLVPQWALGYQQSRYSYMTADELRGVAARLRQERVPTDVLWLDIDWQDRNRPFTVDSKAFPDMKALLSDLKRDGFKVVTITDLHVAQAPDQGYRPMTRASSATPSSTVPTARSMSGRCGRVRRCSRISPRLGCATGTALCSPIR